MQLLRDRLRGSVDDTNVMLFESALGEIGANVMTHGRKERPDDPPVEYKLRGPPLHNQLTRAMPEPTSEAGRGLAIARQVLDELGYEREGEVNTWRLVKRL